MDFDVLIIGSGAGGGTSALSLCEQGFKVGLIERGPRFDPKKDFILNYPDWETRRDPLDAARSNESTIDKNYRAHTSLDGKKLRRSSFVYHRVQGVGGSTLHYQGEAHRLPEHAFNQQNEFGWGVDWPINYSDLEPYYSKIEKLLGVAGETGNPFKPDREAFPTPAQPLSARSLLLKDSAKKVGMTMLPNTLALPSTSVDGRLPCQHSGGCNYGCVFGAKSSVDQAIIPKAEATGNLTLLVETQVTRLNLNSIGDIESVACVQDGKANTFTARRYILAGGALETPRLMLASGFANSYDQIGRYFMETVIAYVRLTIDTDAQLYRGPPMDSRIWDFSKPDNDQSSGFTLGSVGYLYPSRGPAHHAIRTQGIGRAHKQKARDSFGKTVLLFGITEQEANADNRLTLSDAIDANGVPKLNVHSEYSDRDIYTLSLILEKLNAWGKATPKSTILQQRTSQYRSSATHVAGTCRMGNDPKKSVVDAYGKIHGCTNGYITDGSVMPTQGPGDSPSLTIQALALRTAERIGEDLKSN